MAFCIKQFKKIRPYLFHLTSERNVPRILKSGCIQSTASLVKLARENISLRDKRKEIVPITIDGEIIELRDQAPLYEGKAKLLDNWNFGDLVEFLNNRIFFWPGNDQGPVLSGKNHFFRYKEENPVVLQIETEVLFDANPKNGPFFCKYNSGAPRTTMGQGSPRGTCTFVDATLATFLPSQVVEVAYLDSVVIQGISVQLSNVRNWI